jgi:hypothetical protein
MPRAAKIAADSFWASSAQNTEEESRGFALSRRGVYLQVMADEHDDFQELSGLLFGVKERYR